MGQRERAIVVEGLWEEFRVAEDRAVSFKEVISTFRLSRGRRSLWALQDVTLEIQRGETVGLIGQNGSGKSTLLRCIAGILPPTRGLVLVGGTLSSLIELGAGFHPELTGRENSELTAAFFGFSRKRFRRVLDDIVEFAELQDAFDRPIRAYSSGMIVRLAFSLAIHVEPEILLIDEVLAVGDESFQRKCIRKVGELREAGITIVFVSHDMRLVKRLCQRCVWLDEGVVAADGETSLVIDQYLNSVTGPANGVESV